MFTSSLKPSLPSFTARLSLTPLRFAASHDTPISHQSTPATAYLVLDGLQIAIALLAVVIAIAKYRLLSRLKPNMALDRDQSIDIEAATGSTQQQSTEDAQSSDVVTMAPPKTSPSDPKNPPIRPCVTSQYDVWTGAVRRDEINGKIFKDGRKTDVTTLLTFNFPPETEGKTCSFHFDPAPTVSGSGQFDVFVSLAPASHSADSWPSGNLRDQHIGRMVAHSDRVAEWLPGFPDLGQSFPCPAGQTYGGELVGVGDADHVEWLAGTSGPYITWS
ncbi:hypothetical protein Q7P37_007595 [Cladosporium fusiforme]